MKVNKQAVNNILEEIKPARLIAATKYVDEKEIEELENCGCLYYGENRVQAFLDKYDKYHGSGHWHFIGTLQKNKVKYIIDKVELIHSVNSYGLIDELEKQASKRGIKVHVLIQVNIAREESKHGFEEDEMSQVMEYVRKCPSLIVDGLMMMAPHIEPEDTRIYFKKTKDLLEQLKEKYPEYPLNELSMGMSQDYKIALEEGATLVRIGRALFEEE
ncbi:YggS family pyridoxal phosphate-dependent enzyme [Candidatus Stoquefichus massiliensis]|uniref:YggS family pyridoxal phosphate-dependent enzyme n=1 Tax=Candidatus Stoquefichus massiliensis TaxID=1470350 RepID=UPI000486501F|nr:YggS family pyridoxal phosphate-dependent enzyme [Candidatus Stoquefichus massiliensis]